MRLITTGNALQLIRRLVVPVFVLVIWYSVTASELVSRASIPSPLAVLDAWKIWIFGPQSRLAWYSGTWGPYVLASFYRVAYGFSIAAAMGIGLGVLLGWYSKLQEVFEGTFNFLRAVPLTAWVPFAVFIFGIQDSAAIFLISFGTFFPILLNTVAGAQQTPRVLIRAAQMLGTPPHKLLFSVVIPSALPSIFTGLRVGIGLAWVLVIVAEMLAVQGGLGFALWSAYQFARLDLMLASIVSIGVLGLVSDRLLYHLGRRITRWQKGLVGQ